MTTFNTGNQVPSTDGKDLSDNAETIDELVNDSLPSTITRIGKEVLTRNGLEKQYVFTAINGGVWAAGQSFTAFNQYMVFSGTAYKPANIAALPYVVGATPIGDANVEVVGNLSTAQGDSRYGREVATLANWQVDTGTQAGDVITTKERSTGKGGGATGDVISGTGTANGRNIVAHDSLSLSWVLRTEKGVFWKEFGADPTGATDDAVLTQAAYDFGVANDLPVFTGSGTFKTNITIHGGAKLMGSGKEATKLIAANNALPVIIVFGTVTEALESYLSDMIIDGLQTAQFGLQLGDATLFGNSNGTVKRVTIQNFTDINVDMQSATNCTYEQVYGLNSDGFGLFVASERNYQLTSWTNCRFRLNKVGAQIQSGNRITYINTNFESNTDTGMVLLRTNTSGPGHSTFVSCWWENNGVAPVSAVGNLVTSIHIDMLNTIESTSVHNLKFITCNITGAPGAFDVTSARAQGVEFERCSFSPEFDSTRFAFSGTGDVFIKLKDSGTINLQPSPTLYTSFPALTTTAQNSASLSATQGFEYEFDFEGYTYSNKKVYEVAADPSGSLSSFDQEQVVFDSTNLVYYKAQAEGTTDWLRISDPFRSTYTTAELADISSSANTRDKFEGREVFDTTATQPLWTASNTAGATWRDATGVTVVTPV